MNCVMRGRADEPKSVASVGRCERITCQHFLLAMRVLVFAWFRGVEASGPSQSSWSVRAALGSAGGEPGVEARRIRNWPPLRRCGGRRVAATADTEPSRTKSTAAGAPPSTTRLHGAHRCRNQRRRKQLRSRDRRHRRIQPHPRRNGHFEQRLYDALKHALVKRLRDA